MLKNRFVYACLYGCNALIFAAFLGGADTIMTKTFEVVFEDHVLKPLCPVEGMHEHERAWVLIRPLPDMKSVRRLFGTLTQAEAQSMRNMIADEFEQVEGQW